MSYITVLLSLLAEREVYDGGRVFSAENLECLVATRNYEIADEAMADRFSVCAELTYFNNVQYARGRSKLSLERPHQIYHAGRNGNLA